MKVAEDVKAQTDNETIIADKDALVAEQQVKIQKMEKQLAECQKMLAQSTGHKVMREKIEK